MLQLRPMDTQVPIFDQLGEDIAPVILIVVFTDDAADVPALLKAWEDDANWALPHLFSRVAVPNPCAA